MKVLVLGASGMAGHVISTYLDECQYVVHTVAGKRPFGKETKHIDATKLEEVSKLLESNKYDAVINCIGMLVQASEEHKTKAIQLNSLLPHFLEEQLNDTDTKIIHISTDCVFSGINGPYKEDDTPDGKLFYDRTKSLGEINNDKDLTFRMSIIGPDMQLDGIGLFNWFFSQEGTIKGFTNAIWNGITTIQLAKAIENVLSKDMSLVGLYHLVPNTNISKYDLLVNFKNMFTRNDITIEEDDRDAPNKTLLNTRNDFEYKLPSYPDMIREMKKWILDHRELYPQYLNKLEGSK